MFKLKRRGVALITVVLISALLFVSIIGITLKVIPENKIIAARSASERALTAAEAGINQVLFNLRNADFTNNLTVPPGTTEPSLTYLTIYEVEQIRDGSVGFVLTKKTNLPNPYLSGTPAVTYWVKITKNSDDGAMSNRTIGLTVDSLGIVFQDKNNNNALDTTDDVLARRVVETKVTYKINITTTTTIQGAIISGGDITFIGNSNTVFTGDIYADGNIDLNSQSGNAWVVLSGDAYAHGYVDSGIVSDPNKKHENAPSNSGVITDIINNFKWYILPSTTSISDAFKSGTPPYDGMNPEYDPTKYPNTNRSYLGDPASSLARVQVDSIMNSYLGDSSNFGTSSQSGVANFYTDLFSGKILLDNPGLEPAARTFFLNLVNPQYSEKIVTYYKGTGADKVVDKETLSNVDFKLGGVLIIDGDLKINGNDTINPDNNPLIVIVTGDVDLKGGGTFNGSIYAASSNSKVSAGNFTINGTLVSPGLIDIAGDVTCNGTIISQTGVRLNGTNKIYYNSGYLPSFLQTGVSISTNNGNSASTDPSSWKEIPYDPSFWQ